MIKTNEQFEFIAALYKERKTGPSPSDEMFALAKQQIFNGAIVGGDENLRHRARKLAERIKAFDERLSDWPTKTSERIQVINELTGGRKTKPEVIDAAISVLDIDGATPWSESVKRGLHIHSIKFAVAKTKAFNDAAQLYQSMLE